MFRIPRSPANATSRHSRRPRHLWGMERLEDRVLLSGNPTVYTVTDTTDDPGYPRSLRSAITAANGDTNPAGSQIRFDATVFSSPTTITLSGTLELMGRIGPEVIEGLGVDHVTISGNHAVQVLR